MYPYNYKRGQTIQTDATVATDRAFIAHYNIPAASATAESDTAVLALTVLGTAAATVTAGITSPAVPRNVKVDCSVAGVTTKVTVNGTNCAGAVISEELTLDGVTAAPGALAFASITSVVLPIRTHAPAYQKTTSQVTHAADKAGALVLTVTAAILDTTKDVSVVIPGAKTAAEVAALIVAGLNLDEDVGAAFTAAVADTDKVTLTAKAYAAQDNTVNLVVKTDADTTAITIGAITANTTAGVAEDKVSVGLGKKFGLPYMLTAAELAFVKLFNNAADTGTVTVDANELEKNVIALNGTPDGLKPIDLYILV